MGKKQFQKRPPYIVFEKQVGELQLTETNRICKIVPELCMNKVLKEIPIPLTSYSINNKAGELLIQELLHDYY